MSIATFIAASPVALTIFIPPSPEVLKWYRRESQQDKESERYILAHKLNIYLFGVVGQKQINFHRTHRKKSLNNSVYRQKSRRVYNFYLATESYVGSILKKPNGTSQSAHKVITPPTLSLGSDYLLSRRCQSNQSKAESIERNRTQSAD